MPTSAGLTAFPARVGNRNVVSVGLPVPNIELDRVSVNRVAHCMPECRDISGILGHVEGNFTGTCIVDRVD